MENILRVEIKKCSQKTYWYNRLIGFEVNVVEYDDMDYMLVGNKMLLISKSDVEPCK